MLDRRNFLKLGGAAAVASACEPRHRDGQGTETSPAATPPGTEMATLDVSALAEAMDLGALSSREIVETAIARIEALDHAGPGVRSVLELNPDAERIAEALDAERRERGPRGPLHGIPVLLKDNIDTADGMTTTAGSLALEGSTPLEDSAVARQLRQAGAVLLGKTNLSEWANFRSTRSTSGWSARGGQTKNPHVLDRNPCGSSSGSAAAVAAGFAPLAIGTETDGSIICPSSSCGVVGVKPTVGLVSRTGIIPISRSQDTAGPMGRSVHDAALLLDALLAPDGDDPAAVAADGHRDGGYAGSLEGATLEGSRLGVVRRHFGFHPGVDALMEAALEALAAAGAEIVDPVEIPANGMGEAEWLVLQYEFKAGIEAYLARLGAEAPARTLADLIAFNEAHSQREMPHFGQEIFLLAQEKGPLTEPAYREALATCRRLARDEGIDRVVAEHRLDALVAPSGGPAWLTDWINGDHFGGGSSALAAVAGYPNVTVPAGDIHGLPVGISFFGAAFTERRLLGIAHAFEQATRHRVTPRFLTTAEL